MVDVPLPLPLPRHSLLFCSCPSFLDEPREETLTTQATYLLIELFCTGMPVVRTDGRSLGVRSRDYQIFWDG